LLLLLRLLVLLLLLLLLKLGVRLLIVPKVRRSSIAIVRLLGAPDLLLSLRVGKDGLRKGGGSGRKLSAIIGGAVIVVPIKAKIQL
jgi:hypothetical protein